MANNPENGTSSNVSLNFANRSVHTGNQDGTLINFNSNEAPVASHLNNQYLHLPPVPPRSFEAKGVRS